MNASSTRGSVPAGVVVVVLGVLWGADFPAIDVVVARLPPLWTAGLRFAVAGCVVLGYAGLTRDRLVPATGRECLTVGLVGSLVFGGFQGALYLGTRHVTGAVAAVVNTTMPVVAALVAVPLLGESRGLLDGVGFCLGAAGVVVLSRPSAGASSATTLGVGLVFLGTVLFALGSVTVQAVDHDLPVEALQGWAMLVGATLLFCGGLARGEAVPAPGAFTPAVVGALLYVVLVSGVVGYLLFFRLVRRVGATETTLVTYLEPVSAAAVSVLVLDRTVGGPAVVGFLLVAAGFTVVSRDTLGRTLGGLGRTETTPADHDHGHSHGHRPGDD